MPRRVLEGQIVSDKGDKTVTVLVERRVKHPVYKKFIRKSAKYAAHDENNEYGVGDTVTIEECAPISKRKRWKVTALKQKARLVGDLIVEDVEKTASKAKKKAGSEKAAAAEAGEKKEA